VINVFIGYDPRESIAYHVLSHSIMRRASAPVAIIPLYLPYLESAGLYKRPRDPNQSTEFTFSRFLAPYLAGFKGPSIFMDCDMLCLGDIVELVDIARKDPYQDVFVVKHMYQPREETKFLGHKQTTYPCKNWSSLMVFNGHRSAVRRLRPDYVSEATAMQLHQFKWADSVGELPVAWNHLVGELPPNPDAKLVHFTQGGPYFTEYRHCEYAHQWFAECANATHAENREKNLQEQSQSSMIVSNLIERNYADLQTEGQTEAQTQATRKTVRRTRH
jgi:hypothetical protein